MNKNKSTSKKTKEFPIHKIRSFDDLMNVLNDDNCDMIFGNFYGCVLSFLKLRKIHPELKMSGFDWIDDGKIEVREPKISTSKRFKIVVEDKIEINEPCQIEVSSSALLPDGWKEYKCTDCQEINIKKDNGQITVGYCDNCEHPLWNSDVG